MPKAGPGGQAFACRRSEPRHAPCLETGRCQYESYCNSWANSRLQLGALPIAPLFFHKLQRALKRGQDQSGQDYSMQLALLEEEREELQWWVDHLTAWNSKTLMTEKTVDSHGVGCFDARNGIFWLTYSRKAISITP